MVPVYDALGQHVSLRVRQVPGEGEPMPGKERPPWGGYLAEGARFDSAGLVFACPIAQAMLAGDRAAHEIVRLNGLVITEGMPAFLAWATRWAWRDDDDVRAVLGIFSGSWTNELAARLPLGHPDVPLQVLIDTDPDKDGDKYRKGIEASLAGPWRRGQVEIAHSTRLASHLRALEEA